jgi:hypothetical protein
VSRICHRLCLSAVSEAGRQRAEIGPDVGWI